MYRILPFVLLLTLILTLPLFSQTSEAAQGQIPLLVNPAYACVDDDGLPDDLIAYADEGVKLLDVATGEVKTLVEKIDFDSVLSWSPDGTHLAFDSLLNETTGIYDIEVAENGDAVGDPQVLFDDPDIDESHPVWSPDGQHLAFTAYGKLYIGDVNSKTRLEANTIDAIDYAWLLDGSALIYTKSLDDGQDTRALYRTDPITGETTEVAPFLPNASIVDVASDGLVLLHTFHEGQSHLITSDVASGSLDIPAADGGWGWWSPDGTQMVYISDGDGSSGDDFTLMNRDGTGKEVLTNQLAPEVAVGGKALWSPDGNRIAFTAYGEDYPLSGAIHVLDIATHAVQGYEDALAGDTSPLWRPCAVS
ncbi:MAG TPA: hypothetical protein VHL11_21540 [Phototrophicaceae bacterium]|nr:hypothetical protein [Phototrophicaceae bacterium]